MNQAIELNQAIVMHLTRDEQQILGANFHRETGLVRTDLAGRRARVMNREYDRLTIHEVTRAQMYATAAKVMPPDSPTDEELRTDAEDAAGGARALSIAMIWAFVVVVVAIAALMHYTQP